MNEPTEMLERAVASIVDQDPPVEVLIVDSGDGHAEGVTQWYPEARYTWCEPANPATARNVGLDMAWGDVIAFCDADDYWLPGKLEAQLEAIAGGASFVYTNQYVGEAGSTALRRESATELPSTDPHVAYFRRGQGIGSRTVAVTRELISDHRFEPNLDTREDPHLWTRLLAESPRVERIGEALAVKEKRDDSATADPAAVHADELAEISSLVSTLSELEAHEPERLFNAKLRYGRGRLGSDNRTARRVLVDAVRSSPAHADARTAAALVAAVFPGPLAGTVYRSMQRIEGAVA